MKYIEFIIILILLANLFACKENIENNRTNGEIDKLTQGDFKVFEKLPSSITGVSFSNNLIETDTLNYFTNPYIYMGGGVSAGDINNDGLIDLFFTGNMVPNKLYLNKGDLKFEDVTKNSGLANRNDWYTGVTMADVNNDGLLDIYCSISGQSGNKENQLYINNGDLSFTEKGKAYGINDAGNSMQSTFFDYDNDGDLDLYVANYPFTPVEYVAQDYKIRMNNVSITETDNLYRNDGLYFTKVTKEVGLMQYSLSIGVTVSDINNDGWTDIYVSNDFHTPDLLYINNQDGTFSNVIKKATKHTSFYGMGVDIADYNNDCFQDIYQMDMDSPINRRAKANMASMDPLLFENVRKVGFQTQYMQNALQLNRGVFDNNLPMFSEVSRLSGVSSTDWSWAPLFADLDNDGWKDIFVSNGTRREITDKDYFASLKGEKKTKDSLLTKSLKIPSEPIENYVFKNNRDLTFENVNSKWGIGGKGFSNGSIYADLDNDGDLEIIINNIDDEATIYENKSSEFNNYVTFKFKGLNKNPFGLGVKVILSANNNTQYQELTLTRGFQSSVAPEMHFGVGKSDTIDEIKILWPDGAKQVLQNIKANQRLILEQDKASKNNFVSFYPKVEEHTLFTNIMESSILYKHKENTFDDFKYEVLLPHKMSTFGPGLSTGDLNGDKLDDIYIGAAKGYPGGMFFQNKDGSFTQQKTKVLIEDRVFEDMGAVIFDADNDGDNDLYIVSGGNEVGIKDSLLQDRLYVNDGNGNFIKSSAALPRMKSSGSRVMPFDYDKDGDIDLFVGGRQVPAYYPYPANSHILENVSNKGIPKFKDVTGEVAPIFNKLGMVTTALWLDYDQDGWTDLIVTGEWMPIKIFRNIKGKFQEVSSELGLSETSGWWFSLASGDFDKDGDMDFIGGNLGLNYKYKAKEDETFDIYFNDFDGNEKGDIVLSYYNEGEKYPVRGRECSSQQIPLIKERFKNYKEFSTATLTEVYGKEKLDKSIHYQVKSFASAYFENRNGKFVRHNLPNEAQIAPINQILVKDFDKDGNLDALIAGNLYGSEVETPRADAGIGLYLKGNGKGGFESVPAYESGFFADGDVKDMSMITIKGKKYIAVAKNSDFLQLVEWKK